VLPLRRPDGPHRQLLHVPRLRHEHRLQLAGAARGGVHADTHLVSSDHASGRPNGRPECSASWCDFLIGQDICGPRHLAVVLVVCRPRSRPRRSTAACERPMRVGCRAATPHLLPPRRPQDGRAW
jgi:hypothetical protein